jgi:hypothetical protein
MRIEPLRVIRAVLTSAAIVVCGVSFAADEIHWTITGPTSVTFDWRGSLLENGLLYGLSAGNYTTAVTATNPTGTCIPFSSAGPFWEAELTGLAADTLYHYSIANGPDHAFRTPPLPGASSFSILAEGDISDSGAASRMPIVQQLMAGEFDARFALMVGDLAYGNKHGQDHVDQHYNDVMVWSRDAAYMPAWGNHEWETEAVDDLRNYKGRFDFVNSHASPGSPAVSDCGEDWYWFDYGNTRFIAYPEPWTGAWADWNSQVTSLMDAAQADPNIRFIVTFGHRPAYSSGHHPGSESLKGYLDALATSHAKYVININGHSHNYERTYPQDGAVDNRYGVVHLTVGTGGSALETDGPCLWLTCDQPTWSAARYFHLGYLKLTFEPSSITGSFICGPASPADDVTCTQGSVLDSFVLTPSLCRDRDNDGYGAPGDGACPNGPVSDCDDGDSSVHPGAPQVCDGVSNNCSAAGWPSLPGTNEFDNDADGLSACAGDCNDANVLCRDGCSDTDGDNACNDRDNCPTISNFGQANADGDAPGDLCDTCTDTDGDGNGNPGFPPNTCPLDCDPVDPLTYHGATEVNDGRDNECPGDPDYGLIDETSGNSGFHSPTNTKTEYSWPSQPNATGWELARSVTPDFSLGCTTVATSVPSFTDAEVPQNGQVFYYLNRPTSPFVGSWGAHSSGVERGVICPATGMSTLTVGVTASSDDAEETDTGSMRLTSSDLDLTLDGSKQKVGLRFNGLTIPHGARILNAYVQFAVRDATSADTSLTIRGQSDDNPPTFTTTNGDLSSRGRTAASASWNPPAWTSGAGPDQRTPSLTAIVREIVNRPGWVGGNSLVIIITGTGDRSARSWEYDSVNHSGVPVLHVEFDGGGP